MQMGRVKPSILSVRRLFRSGHRAGAPTGAMPPGLWCNESMKLLVFAGSTRQNSWNRKLAQRRRRHGPQLGRRGDPPRTGRLRRAHVQRRPGSARHAGRRDEAQADHLRAPGLDHLHARVQRQLSGPAEEHARLDLQPGQVRPGLERRFPLHAAARWSACSAPHPGPWAGCARKATWCRCCSTCTAGWPPRITRWAARPTRSMRPAS